MKSICRLHQSGTEETKDSISESNKSEMEQFPNLKKMLIFGNERDAESLRKVCDPLGIEVEPMACTSV